MSDNGLALACACAPELLCELWDAARSAPDGMGEWPASVYAGRLENAARASFAIIEELRAGRIKLVPVEAVHDA